MRGTELRPDERERVDLFRARVNDLGNKGLVRAGKLTVTVHLSGPVPELLSGVDHDYLESFLQTLRQFTLQKDDVHFLSVHNIVSRRCARQELQEWLLYTKRL